MRLLSLHSTYTPSFLTLFALTDLVLSSAPRRNFNDQQHRHDTNAVFLFHPERVQGECPFIIDEIKVLSVPPETCLTGNSTLQHKIKLANTPVCHDSTFPVLIVYDGAECIGPQLTSYTYTPIHQCLLPEAPEKWSLIFRCGYQEEALLLEGAENHMAAIPPERDDAAARTVSKYYYQGQYTYLQPWRDNGTPRLSTLHVVFLSISTALMGVILLSWTLAYTSISGNFRALFSRRSKTRVITS